MKFKKQIIILLFSLLFSVISIGSVSAITTLHVDPEWVTAPIGENFTVDISLDNVENLFGFDFKLGYNTTFLNITKVEIFPPWGTYYIVKNETDEILGIYWLAVTALTPSPPFYGNTTLAKITFLVTDMGECALDLFDTKLADRYGNPIPHDVIDGYFVTSSHDVAIIEVIPNVTEIILGDTLDIDVLAKNEGTFTETFEVSVYYDENLIDTQEGISLDSGATTTLEFTWDTTGVTPGAYTISANASIVEGETDTADNIFIDGTVRVLVPPVATFVYEMIERIDNVTNVAFNASASYDPDGAIVSYAWNFSDGTTAIETDPIITHNYTEFGDYNVTLTVTDNDGLTNSTMVTVKVCLLKGDVDGNGIVDIFDLVKVAGSYGKTCSDPDWDYNDEIADLNDDCIVDIFDLVIVARDYGKTC